MSTGTARRGKTPRLRPFVAIPRRRRDRFRYRYSAEELAEIARQVHDLRRRPACDTVFISFINDDATGAGADNAVACAELIHGLAGEAVPRPPKSSRTMRDFFDKK